MKNKRFFMIGVFVVIFIIIAITLFSIILSSRTNQSEVNIYYLNPITNQLTPEKTTVKMDTNENRLSQTLKFFTQEPRNSNLTNVLPEEVKILKCTLAASGSESGKLNAIVDLSNEYKNIKEGQELLCRAALVWTLTEFDFVENVIIEVEGNPLLRANSEELGKLNRENVVLNPIISPVKIENIEAILYFSNDQATDLIAESRKIEVKQNQSLENQIVEQLIKGPETSSLYPTVPPETKIKNIKTEEDICYVDLSNDFVLKHTGGSTAETLTIYSIVNSLTELKSVKKVQFLIEGEKVNTFKGHYDFSKPFERDSSLIIENTKVE